MRAIFGRVDITGRTKVRHEPILKPDYGRPSIDDAINNREIQFITTYFHREGEPA